MDKVQDTVEKQMLGPLTADGGAEGAEDDDKHSGRAPKLPREPGMPTQLER